MNKMNVTKGEFIADDIAVINQDGQCICQVYDGGNTHISEMDTDIVEANAELIAEVCGYMIWNVRQNVK